MDHGCTENLKLPHHFCSGQQLLTKLVNVDILSIRTRTLGLTKSVYCVEIPMSGTTLSRGNPHDMASSGAEIPEVGIPERWLTLHLHL